MTEETNELDKATKKPYWRDEGSLESQLSKLSKNIRRMIARKRARAAADARAMEKWARDGFVSSDGERTDVRSPDD